MIDVSDSGAAHRTFGCRVEGSKRAPTLHLTGEVDMAAVPALAAAATKLVDDPRPAVLRVDCGGVTFLDCSALRVLLDLDSRASARGKAVCWRHVPGCMRRVLELTRTATSFAVVD